MRDENPAECSEHCHGLWHLHNGTLKGHYVMRESATGVIVCGDSWCSGDCGFPALVLRAPTLDHEMMIKTGVIDDLGPREPAALKAHGCMVAYGPIWQTFRAGWTGAMVDATLGSTPLENALRRHWV